jgi:hypothetical protein
MMVVRELHQRDWVNRVAFARNMLETVADDAAIGMMTRRTSTYLGVLINRTSISGMTQIHGSFMNALFTLNV